jgi:hypothetical protein
MGQKSAEVAGPDSFLYSCAFRNVSVQFWFGFVNWGWDWFWNGSARLKFGEAYSCKAVSKINQWSMLGRYFVVNVCWRAFFNVHLCLYYAGVFLGVCFLVDLLVLGVLG